MASRPGHEVAKVLDMIDPTKLLRGAFLALAILAGTTLTGTGVPGVGVSQAVAQSPVVATILFEGNRRFTDAQLLSMIDTTSRGAYTTDSVSRDAESIRLAYLDSGYNDVDVSTRVEPVDAGRARVVF